MAVEDRHSIPRVSVPNQLMIVPTTRQNIASTVDELNGTDLRPTRSARKVVFFRRDTLLARRKVDDMDGSVGLTDSQCRSVVCKIQRLALRGGYLNRFRLGCCPLFNVEDYEM